MHYSKCGKQWESYEVEPRWKTIRNQHSENNNPSKKDQNDTQDLFDVKNISSDRGTNTSGEDNDNAELLQYDVEAKEIEDANTEFLQGKFF